MTIDEKEVFVAALAVSDAGGREAYLQEACAGRPELLGRLRELLSAHEESQGPLDRRPVALGGTVDATPAERPGTVIGPYKLLQQIGEGGMGTVFMAEQAKPVQRKVALKVIKPGMDSRQVVARFEAERQALAMMDHVNIARVLDAGTTDAGLPYFVMELVHGIPITKYCDDNHLTPRERLELFVPVCQAIQHAHQKGIIHRDVKPSNVLVTLYDGKPVPKVIDFGVAKAIEQKLTERTLFTQYGTMIGTFEHMSPEQAEMSALGVDTRSDIYSLGVLLYELLTGSTPLTHKRMKEAAYAEILRMIKEEEPPKPSTRLSDSGAALASISANRHMEPAKLTKLMRGELDWIVMKCLDKDRNRRYETANGFAQDVERYLADEPVLACPPSTFYRLKKFVRRNKGAVVAASLVAIALLGGIIGTTFGLVRAEQRAAGERRAKDSAEKRLAQIEKGIDLLGLMFEDLDPLAEEKEGRPLRAILGERLDQAAVALDGEAVGDPLVVARLQERLGRTYLGLGHAARAEALFTRAVTTRRAHLDADDPLTLGSMHNQALAYDAAGKHIEATKRFEQVRDARVKVLGADHLDTLSTLHYLAWMYTRAGKPTEAIPLLEQVRDGRVKRLGEDHEHTLATLQNLSRAYTTVSKHPEAIALAAQVRDVLVKKHGDDHAHSIDALHNLAYAYQAGYKMPEALTLFEQARDITVPKLGSEHPLTLRILHSLGTMYRAYGKTTKAIALLEQVRERRAMILGGQHGSTLMTLFQLALAYRDAGELDKALPLLQQAAAGVEKLKFAHSYADRIVCNLFECHEQEKQYEQAEVWRRKWLAVVKERDVPASLTYASAQGLSGLGSNLLQQRKYAAAEPILRESLAILQKKQPEAETTFHTQSLLGGALLGQRKYAEAGPLLLNGYHGMKKAAKGLRHKQHVSSTTERLTATLGRLVQLYDAWGKPDEAAKWRKELQAHGTAAENTVKPKDK